MSWFKASRFHGCDRRLQKAQTGAKKNPRATGRARGKRTIPFEAVQAARIMREKEGMPIYAIRTRLKHDFLVQVSEGAIQHWLDYTNRVFE